MPGSLHAGTSRPRPGRIGLGSTSRSGMRESSAPWQVRPSFEGSEKVDLKVGGVWSLIGIAPLGPRSPNAEGQGARNAPPLHSTRGPVEWRRRTREPPSARETPALWRRLDRGLRQMVDPSPRDRREASGVFHNHHLLGPHLISGPWSRVKSARNRRLGSYGGPWERLV